VAVRLRPAGLLLAAACLAAPGCRLIDAAADGDGDGEIDASAASCPPVSLLSDDFEDGVTSADWTPWSDAGATLEEADGSLRVIYSGASPAWAGYSTVGSHDMRGGSFAAHVRQVGGMTIMELNAGSTKVQTHADLFTLHATVIVDGDTITSFETDYLSASHVHWRMREQDGRIHWETSTDGVDWTEIDARPTPLALDSVTLLVSGGGVDGDAAAEFESVDIEVADPDCAPAATRRPVVQ
jgi:hypothetical protein